MVRKILFSEFKNQVKCDLYNLIKWYMVDGVLLLIHLFLAFGHDKEIIKLHGLFCFAVIMSNNISGNTRDNQALLTFK